MTTPTLIFYEKPGCVGNRQQQQLLRSQGIDFEVRDLLSTPWSRETLRPFFNLQPVAEWFNLSAPVIKEGRVDIHAIDEYDALTLMVDDPLFIRRPLLALGETLQSGFCQGPVLEALGVVLDPQEDLQRCPMSSEFHLHCGAPS